MDVENASGVGCPSTSGLDAQGRRNLMEKKSILDSRSLTERCGDLEIKELHIEKLYSVFCRHPNINSIDELIEECGGTFPLRLVQLLQDEFILMDTKIVESIESSDKSTVKMLIQLFDGHNVEAVIMRYGDQYGNEDGEGSDGEQELNLVQQVAESVKERKGAAKNPKKITKKRSTLCVTSQVGCRMACSFCATGTMGYLGGLTSGEILEQVIHALRVEPIRNIVFMGMGEPLDNYEDVVGSIKHLTHPRYFAFASSHVTLSTVGVADKIRMLIDDCPTINLAISLHAPNQKAREYIIPTARKNQLADILDACHAFVTKNDTDFDRKKQKKSGLLVQYCLIEGVNDSVEDADEIARLLDQRDGMLKYTSFNIIPYNYTSTPLADIRRYKAPGRECIVNFFIALKERGVAVYIRQEKGSDIAGACGQLVVKRIKKNMKPSSSSSSSDEENTPETIRVKNQDDSTVAMSVIDDSAMTAPAKTKNNSTVAMSVIDDSAMAAPTKNQDDLTVAIPDLTPQNDLTESMPIKDAIHNDVNDCAVTIPVQVSPTAAAAAAVPIVTYKADSEEDLYINDNNNNDKTKKKWLYGSIALTVGTYVGYRWLKGRRR